MVGVIKVAVHLKSRAGGERNPVTVRMEAMCGERFGDMGSVGVEVTEGAGEGGGSCKVKRVGQLLDPGGKTEFVLSGD